MAFPLTLEIGEMNIRHARSVARQLHGRHPNASRCANLNP
jgi:hypothetical protein